MAESSHLAKEGWQLTERSLKIVNDLLNAARIEEGRFGFNFEETDLAEFCRKNNEGVRLLATKEYGIKSFFRREAGHSVSVLIKNLRASPSPIFWTMR